MTFPTNGVIGKIVLCDHDRLFGCKKFKIVITDMVSLHERMQETILLIFNCKRAQKNAWYDFCRSYLPWNGVIAKIVLGDRDLLFEDNKFEQLISETVRASTKMHRTKFVDFDICDSSRGVPRWLKKEENNVNIQRNKCFMKDFLSQYSRI